MPVNLDPPPPPPRRYSAAELAKMAKVTPRTLRHYVSVGLLAKPKFRARKTSYGREHLVRLLAIQKLRAQKLRLDEIKERLAGATVEELARQVLPESAAPPMSSAGPDTDLPGPRWSRAELLPGCQTPASWGHP